MSSGPWGCMKIQPSSHVFISAMLYQPVRFCHAPLYLAFWWWLTIVLTTKFYSTIEHFKQSVVAILKRTWIIKCKNGYYRTKFNITIDNSHNYTDRADKVTNLLSSDAL